MLNCNREIICENMQIQEKCAMVLFDKFFDHKLDGESRSRVTIAGSSVNPKENRLFRTDGSYLLALLYSWPV